MNVNFEYAKTLAGEGSILLLLSLVPYAGWILGIIGVVLFLKGVRELSNYYQDKEIYQSSWTGVKFYIVAIVAAAVAIASMVIGVGSALGFNFARGATFVFTEGFAVGLVVFLGGLIIAFVFNILAALSLKKTFKSLAEKSGEGSFDTAGNLLWWGAILSIILVGFLLIFIAWIFATIGFFSMKSRQYQQYVPQQNGASSPSSPTQQPSGNDMNQGNYAQGGKEI